MTIRPMHNLIEIEGIRELTPAVYFDHVSIAPYSKPIDVDLKHGREGFDPHKFFGILLPVFVTRVLILPRQILCSEE